MKKVLFPILLICGIVLIILTLYLVPERDVPDTLYFNSPQWHLPEGVKARIGSGRVTVMQYSPDGNLLAVGSAIGVWIYDAYTAEPLSLLAAHSSAINSVSFTPDGETLAAACEDGTIRVWDLSTGEQKHTFTRREYSFGVHSVSFTADGRTLAATSFGRLDLWDIVTGVRKKLPVALENRRIDFDHFPYMTLGGIKTSFSSDRKTVASWSRDGIIRVWDITTRKQVQTITIQPSSGQLIVSLSSDGQLLATTNRNEPIRLWDIDTGTETQAIITDSRYLLNLVFSPDGTILASCYVNEPIRLWDVNTGKEQKTLQRQTLQRHKNAVMNVAFSPDNRTLVSSSYDGSLRMWDIDTGEVKKETIGYGHQFIKNVSLSPDRGTLMSLGSRRDAIHLWNIHTGKHKKTFKGHKNGIAGAKLSPDGKHLMSWTAYDSIIRLWNINTDKLKKLKGPKKHVSGAAFSSDGKTFVSWGLDRNRTIQLWDIKTLHRKRTLEGDWGYMGARYLDRKTFVGLDWHSIYDPVRLHLLDIPTGEYTVKEIMPKKTVSEARTREVSSASFSPDGQTIAIIFKNWPIDKSGRHLNIELWDVNTRERTQILKGHTDDIFSTAFSPDSRTLASGSKDKTVRLWDVNTGQHKQTLTDQDWINDQFNEVGRVWKVAFSPDGRTLASGMWCGPIHLWDIATGQKKKTLTGHTGYVQHLLFSKDSQTLISASGDQTVLIWDLMEQ